MAAVLGLGAYASDSGSDEDAVAGRAETLPKEVDSSTAVNSGNRIGETLQLKASTADFGARLPIVARRDKRKLPLFRKPADDAYGSDSDGEDLQAKKRLKSKANPKSRASGALDFLPKPVNQLPKSARAVSAVREFPTRPAEVEQEPAVPAVPASVASVADMYRVDANGQYLHADLVQAQQADAEAQPDWHSGGVSDLFAAAVAAEQKKAEQRGKHLHAADMTFKEIDGAALKEMPAHQKAELASVREALGTDYVRKLQEDVSGKHQPTKLSKRKHQITSLYHHAKMNELSELEKKSASMKSKAETKSKYGW